jgi:hypothetical protein
MLGHANIQITAVQRTIHQRFIVTLYFRLMMNKEDNACYLRYCLAEV